jgi:PAS domain S-box-containing protein
MVEWLSLPAKLPYIVAFLGSGLVCVSLIARARRFEDPEIRTGLVWLLATTGAWGIFKAAFLMAPLSLQEPSYILGLVAGFATVWAWLYFCSAYTGRNLHRNRTLRRGSAAVFLVVVSAKVTNPVHGLYFDVTRSQIPFQHLAIEHGVLHWSATGLAYILASVGLFMVFEMYVRSGYDTLPLGALTVLLGLPIVFDIVALSTPVLIDFIYAPLGVALFATGVLLVFQDRLVAVRDTVQAGGVSIYLDGERRVRDTSDQAVEIFPALEDAIGTELSAVLPDVASALDDGRQIVERENGGETRYYLVRRDPVGVAGSDATSLTITDVTEFERQRRLLRRREREFEERNELYRAVLTASFAFVFRADLDGELTFLSAPVEDTIGYAPDELRGEPIDVLAPTDELAKEAWTYFDDVSRGEALHITDFPLEHRDGSRVQTDIRVVPIYDAEVPDEDRTTADIVGVQGMVRDTSERHRRDGLVSVINRVLRHNVRNKATVITNYAEILESDLEGESARYARRILDTTDRLTDLSESARKIEETRDESPELQSYDLVPLLREVVGRVESQYPNASISVSAPETAVARTQPRIETAIFELVENAAKHGGDSATIDVEVEIDGKRLVIRITDDGPGLPETERAMLETGTEDPLEHGSGLGLWLAYWIVTTLEGTVDIIDTERGTTVELRLPRPDG